MPGAREKFEIAVLPGDGIGVEVVDAAVRIERAVDAAFASGRLRPFEFGGGDGTAAIRDAVLSNL